MSLTLEEYERLNPRCEVVHAGTRMVFVTPNAFTKGRVDSIYSKEPCTLEWIAEFKPDDILVDVGANVGMYSIWAAATRKIKVFAFEPEAQNYALLNRNILAANAAEDARAKALEAQYQERLRQQASQYDEQKRQWERQQQQYLTLLNRAR